MHPKREAISHYYSETQSSELKPRVIKARLLGQDLEFMSGSGVFSADEIDKGSRLLIESAIIMDGWNVLDMGCGYGAVGISIAKAYDVNVTMTDINRRAVMLAKRNAKLNNVDVNVVQGDMYGKIEGTFDTILVNPPQHAGKDVCFAIIEGSIGRLNKGGILQLVARHNKGGKTLSEKMREVFGNVTDIAKKSGFRVYVSKKG